MRILTYNVALHFPSYGDMIRADKIRQHLIRGDWDIIVLNEVYHKSLRKVLLDDKNIKKKYPYSIYSLSEYGKTKLYTFDNGLAILSKHKIIRYKRHEYQAFLNKISNKLLPRKDILFAEIEFNNDRIGIFFTHLQWGNSNRQIKYRYKQMSELKIFIENEWRISNKMILLGDFNIFGDIHGKDYSYFRTQFPDLIDWHQKVGDQKDRFTWHPDNTKVLIPFSKQRFDYIFSSPDIIPISSKLQRFQSRLHLQKRLWEPTDIFSFHEKLWFKIAWISRILLTPVIVLYYLTINLIRISRTHQLIVYYVKRDLSDHFALTGEARINYN